MRLNDGAPVWHASISIRTPDLRFVRSAGVAERHAVALLDGVGSDREWWYWNSAAVLPDLPAEHDAGESGPERRRKPVRRVR
jgi:hypothetical protein